MVTVVYKVTVLPDKVEQFEEIIAICTQSAQETEGCIKYSFYKSMTEPNVYLVYYQFETSEIQKQHIENLRNLLGPSPEGRDLPAAFLNLVTDEDLILFKQ